MSLGTLALIGAYWWAFVAWLCLPRAGVTPFAVTSGWINAEVDLTFARGGSR